MHIPSEPDGRRDDDASQKKFLVIIGDATPHLKPLRLCVASTINPTTTVSKRSIHDLSFTYVIKMGLDTATRAFLERYARSARASRSDGWYGPWTTILTTLFPITQGYQVCPRQLHVAEDDLVLEVAKLALPESPSDPPKMRILLVVEIKDPQHWDNGKERLLQQLGHQTDLAFSRTERGKLFWIGSIGPHWLYGEKMHGKDLKPLIEWHDATYNDLSYHDLDQLVELVEGLWEACKDE